MKYYIGVDGGGTKVITVLFDQDMNLLALGKYRGGINPNFDTLENVRLHMRNSIVECFKKAGVFGNRIDVEKIYLAMPTDYRIYVDVMSEFANSGGCDSLSEGASCLYSGLMKEEGACALSGTGSDVFYTRGNKTCSVGGWGNILGDQGSGYDIASNALKAVVKEVDGWGESTILTQRVKEHFKIQRHWDMVPIVYNSKMSRSIVANLVPLVSKAADDGDAVALRIFAEAGAVLAKQAVALFNKNDIPRDCDMVVSGGVWKSNDIMYNTFREELAKTLPDIKVSKPMFEPLVGPIVAYAVEMGILNDDARKHIAEQFKDYNYKEEY